MLMTEHCSDSPLDDEELEAVRRFDTLWAHSSSSINSLRASQSSLGRLNLEEQARTSITEMIVLARPLMLVLDSLYDTKAKAFEISRSWLQSLPTVQL